MKMIVFCRDANGAPAFHPCEIEVSEAQCESGEHYALAEMDAQANGFEPILAFDPHDPAATQIMDLGTWLYGPIPPPSKVMLWIAVHHHRHGYSIVPHYSEERPDLLDIIQEKYEPEDGDTLELDGPYPVKSAGTASAFHQFVARIACLKIWKPGFPGQSECDEPGDGLRDSHDALVNLIDDARSLLGRQTLSQVQPLACYGEALGRVLGMANAHVEDVESGITEGLYLAADNPDLEVNRQSIELIEGLRRRICQTQAVEAHYLVVVEGDVEPFIAGPFRDSDAVMAEALRQRTNDPERQNGLYWLDVRDGELAIGGFTAGLLAEDEGRQDG